MSRYEDSNYDNDFRVRGAQHRWWETIDDKSMTATLTLYNDDTDEEEELQVPIKFEVCPTCRGKGTHVNPSIDCNGLTADDFNDDPDFLDEYLEGRYDVSCYECHGKRVVPVIDEDHADPEVLKRLEAQQRSEAESRAERAAERRMGA